MKVYTNLDLMLNSLERLRLDPLIDDPALEELQEGRIWYNRSEDVFKYFDGREIQILAGGSFFNTNDVNDIWNGTLKPELQKKLIQGPELFYYTEKVQDAIKAVNDKADSIQDNLDEQVAALNELIDGVDDKAEEADEKASEALEGVEQLQSALQNLSDSMVELIVVSAADFDDDDNLLAIYSDIGKTAPIDPVQNKVYLVPSTNAKDQNVYNEYTWTPADGFECIGSLSFDNLSISDVEDIWSEYFGR